MAATACRNPSFFIFQWGIIGGMEFIVTFGCLCYSIYQLKTNRARNIKLLTFYGTLSYLFGCIVQSVNLWVWNIYFHEFSLIQTISWYTAWFFWSLGGLMTYLLFLNRIETTFKTMMTPSTMTRHCLWTAVSIYFLLWIIAFVLPLFIYIEIRGSTLSRDRVFQIESALSLPIAVMDIALTVSMTFIFVSRLHHLVLTQIEDQNHPQSVELQIIPNRLGRMIRISVKVAVIAITSLTSTVLLMIFRAISFFLEYKTAMDQVASMWMQMDTMISCICLVLFIPNTQRAYDCLCFCCNGIVAKYMEKSLQNIELKRPLISMSQ